MWLKDTTDKEINNSKSLLNIDGSVSGGIFSVKVDTNFIVFLTYIFRAVGEIYFKPIFGHSYVLINIILF